MAQVREAAAAADAAPRVGTEAPAVALAGFAGKGHVAPPTEEQEEVVDREEVEKEEEEEEERAAQARRAERRAAEAAREAEESKGAVDYF